MALFDEGNFLSNIKQILTGNNLSTADDGGFFRDIDVTPQFTNTYASYSSTTGATTNTSSTATLTSTGTSTFGPFFIPRDYDQNTDMFQFRFLGSTAGTGNSTIAVIGSLSVYSTGGTAAVTSAVTVASTTFANGGWNSFGISWQGVGLQYTDAVSVTLSTSGGNIRLGAAAEVIESCLVAFADYYGPATVNGVVSTGAGASVTENVGTSTQLVRYA